MLDIKKYTLLPSLANYIDAYWSIENVSEKDVEIPIVPDGCMDIVYQHQKLFLVGAMSEAFTVNIKPREYTFGIRFKPSILPQILHVKACDFVDKKIELRTINLELFEKLSFLKKDYNERIEKLNIIFQNISQEIDFDTNILKAVDFIKSFNGDIKLNSLEQRLGLSSRQIERIFGRYIGYSPKKFCNIIRFFVLFKKVIKQDAGDLALRAYELGYCDQSHLSKEFKKFSNFSPTNEIMSVFYNTKN